MPALSAKDTEARPTITSRPVGAWVFGGGWLIASLVAFCLVARLMFGVVARAPPDQMLLTLLGALLLLALVGGFVAIGVAAILRPRLTVAFDAGTRTATLSRGNFVRERRQSIAFDDIAAVGQEQDVNEDGSPRYSFRVVMYLHDGRRVPLTAAPAPFAEHEETLARIRQVTGAEKRDAPVPAGTRYAPTFGG